MLRAILRSIFLTVLLNGFLYVLFRRRRNRWVW